MTLQEFNRQYDILWDAYMIEVNAHMKMKSLGARMSQVKRVQAALKAVHDFATVANNDLKV